MLKWDRHKWVELGCREFWQKAAVGVALVTLTMLGALGATPERVLLLHSFGRDFSPFDAFSETFRTELAKGMGGAVDFYDLDVDSARLEGEELEGAFRGYLVALFQKNRPDLVVPIGGPATRFAQKYRERLFATTPMLIAATDERHLRPETLTTNDTAVCVRHDLVRTIENILEVLPETTNIVVVIGNSPHEKFWMEEMRQDFRRFSGRLSFTWFNDLSFTEIQKRAGALPPRSAIFYAVLYVDAEGVPYAGQRVLTSLRSVANAPIFGIHDTQLGYGIVGGPLMSIDDLARTTSEVALRILRGEPAVGIKTPTAVAGRPVYDWRELRRWGIGERRLPTASTIRFRQPAFWEVYKWRIILLVAVACGAIGAVYYRHVAKLKEAQRAQAAFTRQLIVSQENERKRVAAELHDGLGQDLLLIKNRLGLLKAAAQHAPEVLKKLEELTATAVQAIADVRSISRALRPAALEQVGLTRAIEWMIDQIGEVSPVKLASEIDDVDGLLAPDLEINLYRIVQEGLNNVIKHAQATRVIVTVKREPLRLSVSILDDGRGFDAETPQNRRGRKPSLGLVSMAERAKLLAGEMQIESSVGTGTRVTLSLPLPPVQTIGATRSVPRELASSLKGG